MSPEGKIVAVVSAGYEGKRRALARMAELGARLVILEEADHWSQALVGEGVALAWLEVVVTGNADRDAGAVLDALRGADVRPDGILTFWEDSTPVVSRVAAELGLPGNPPEAVDSVRSKVRMREQSASLGLPTPKAQRVRSLDELFAAAASVGFPAVVKPEFGASAVGCVRVDDLESLPGVYRLVRDVVDPEADAIFRAGNDLLLEEYLDGVEFDIDLVMDDGKCVFSSVSQNWPTAEPSFQETGLHCPPDHDRKQVKKLVDLVVETVRAFGLHDGVLHVEGKCTSRGPRIVEINARLGGGRIHQVVESVWGVDLIEEQLRSSLGLKPIVNASRKPQCAVVDAIVYAPETGELVDYPFERVVSDDVLVLEIDRHVDIGDPVKGPEAVFATAVAEVTVAAKDLRRAHELARQVIGSGPTVAPTS